MTKVKKTKVSTTKVSTPLYLFLDLLFGYAEKVCNEIELEFFEKMITSAIFTIPQYEVKTSYGKRRLDFAVFVPKKRIIDPEINRIAIEINGKEYHTGLENMERDEQRDLELKEKGWTIYHFTGQDVHHNPEKCIEFIKKNIKKRK